MGFPTSSMVMVHHRWLWVIRILLAMSHWWLRVTLFTSAKHLITMTIFCLFKLDFNMTNGLWVIPPVIQITWCSCVNSVTVPPVHSHYLKCQCASGNCCFRLIRNSLKCHLQLCQYCSRMFHRNPNATSAIYLASLPKPICTPHGPPKMAVHHTHCDTSFLGFLTLN